MAKKFEFRRKKLVDNGSRNVREVDIIEEAKKKGKELEALKEVKIKEILKGNETKYDPRYCDIARYFAGKGFTHRQMAKKFNVHVNTFDYWFSNIEEFRMAVQAGKDEADLMVEQAFFRSATGYSHPDVKVFVYKGEPIIVPTTTHYPPNTHAAWKWMTTRMKDKWAETQKNELQINIQNNVHLEDFSDEELKALEKVGVKKMLKDAGYDDSQSN